MIFLQSSLGAPLWVLFVILLVPPIAFVAFMLLHRADVLGYVSDWFAVVGGLQDFEKRDLSKIHDPIDLAYSIVIASYSRHCNLARRCIHAISISVASTKSDRALLARAGSLDRETRACVIGPVWVWKWARLSKLLRAETPRFRIMITDEYKSPEEFASLLAEELAHVDQWLRTGHLRNAWTPGKRVTEDLDSAGLQLRQQLLDAYTAGVVALRS